MCSILSVLRASIREMFVHHILQTTAVVQVEQLVRGSVCVSVRVFLNNIC